jgi:hypothetical protein
MEMSMNDWVVTYKIDRPQGGFMLTEFYRGDKRECQRIRAHCSAGSDDRCKTALWQVVIGPAEEWDEFLNRAE